MENQPENEDSRTYQEKLASLSEKGKVRVDQELDYLQGFLRITLAEYEQIEAKLPPPTPAQEMVMLLLQKPDLAMVARVIQIKSMVLGVSEMIGLLEKMRRDLK